MRVPLKPPTTDPLVWDADRQTLDAILDVEDHGVVGGTYDTWDAVRLRDRADGLSPEQRWAGIAIKRRAARRELPLRAKDGSAFFFSAIGDFTRALHILDCNGRSAAAHSETDLQKSLIEEPFSSSVLEGAATTRQIARKMIEDGRPPMNVDEQMVLNNYHAMAFIREHRSEPLTPERILELHRLLTQDTLEKPEKAGVLRAANDDVRVVDSVSGETLHMPPPAAELETRLQALCDFANARNSENGAFLHPVIRAIVLHFMLSYDHPFWDGNGRCARALFYWCVLKHGYWLLEYVSISSVILRAPTQYGMAFLHSETDGGDLTYFIVHQLKVIEESLTGLENYLAAKAKELNGLGEAIGALERQINRRQLALVQAALKSPAVTFGIAEHAEQHRVSYLTARADLERLEKMKLLVRGKMGAKLVFRAPSDINARIARWKKG